MGKTTLHVTGMHCKSCDMLIKDGLEEVKGVTVVHADHSKGVVIVEHNDSVSKKALIEAITTEGYEVKE
ncbi:MAG: heavy-metal-associated domain-containing protein [Candidatus Woesearchaeota archaeon]